MIHYLRQEEKYKSKILWEEAFPEDSSQFREYYYKEKTEDNQILAAESGGRIVSMLHRNPYEIAAGNCLWKCDYLVGVATAKDSRRKGYMRRLMEKALADMRKEHMPFCFLIPALKELYMPFGFAYISEKQEWMMNEKGIADLQKRPFTNQDAESVVCWMKHWLENHYEVYVLPSRRYLERLKKELESERGFLELLCSGSELAGIYAEWGLSEREQRMLVCGAEYRQKKGNRKPCMMGRIVDLQEFVKGIHLKENIEEKELTVILKVQDSQLQGNDGIWRWHLDKTGSFMQKMPEKRDRVTYEQTGIKEKVPDLTLDIGGLTAWLMGYSVPDAAIQYAEKIRSFQGVFLDEVV